MKMQRLPRNKPGPPSRAPSLTHLSREPGALSSSSAGLGHRCCDREGERPGQSRQLTDVLDHLHPAKSNPKCKETLKDVLLFLG